MENEIIIQVVLGPFLMLAIQTFKSFVGLVDKYPLPFVFAGAFGLSCFVVDFSTATWQTVGLDMFAATLAIAGIAIGTYAMKPTKEESK